MKAKTPPPSKDEQGTDTAMPDRSPELDLTGRPTASTTTPALQPGASESREKDGQVG